MPADGSTSLYPDVALRPRGNVDGLQRRRRWRRREVHAVALREAFAEPHREIVVGSSDAAEDLLGCREGDGPTLYLEVASRFCYDERTMKVATGLRYRAKVDVPVTCMTSWAAPYTGGEDRVLPQGEIVVVANNPPEKATAVYAHPENYRKLHAQMVPWRDRIQFWVYRGYYLCIRIKQLEVDFELVS